MMRTRKSWMVRVVASRDGVWAMVAKAGAVVLVNVKGRMRMRLPCSSHPRHAGGKTGVKAKEDKRSRGLLLASEANIDFSQTFQAAHRARRLLQEGALGSVPLLSQHREGYEVCRVCRAPKPNP